ncbi:hypothetical protein HPB50_019132 [Hyalomma asiaticum]|uniref:Uncharacterized protein n=1 Tax=Hyalomma asiaticum TaxID=266040 RepID=A0ACB7SGW9_HYAAI|nr:hypothetical protein HPB50_019132 [Hyalomma asiaticum]
MLLYSNAKQRIEELKKRPFHYGPHSEDDKDQENTSLWIVLYIATLLVVGIGLLWAVLIFVLAAFSHSQDAPTKVEQSIEIYRITDLTDPLAPPYHQPSWHKAHRMFVACVSFADSYRPETKYLVEWMVSMDMDFLNDTILAQVNPVEMMLDYSRAQDQWRKQKRDINDYIHLFTMYGAKPPLDEQLAWEILAYENQLEEMEKITLDFKEAMTDTAIYAVGDYTTPYVTSDDWATWFSKYTNGTYMASDIISYRSHVTEILVNLFKDESVGEDGLRYLVAWSFFRQLVQYTEPYLFLRGRNVNEACYEHVKKVMDLAIAIDHFQQEVPWLLIDEAKYMVSKIRSTFQKAIETSSWIGPNVREAAISKLKNITAYVGSPGRRRNPDFVDEIYKHYPDAPTDLLFPSWMEALSLSTRYIWSDQRTILYDESAVEAVYNYEYNDLRVTTAMMLRPFLYPYGPIALNYGGLGMVAAHEIMHAFDVLGIKAFKGLESQDINDFIKEYTKKALCLRRSHRSVLSASVQQQTLNEILDNENLADLVGTKIAYMAFDSLRRPYRSMTLAGLSMSAEQLFFVNHCVKWCAQYSVLARRYAPFRSRCIVPLMHMPEFSNAFGCAAGTPMNPRDKCTFW